MNNTIGMIYERMEKDYTREIINFLNRFAHEIDVTEIWSRYIFPNYSEEEQFELTYHFLELPLYYCLNQPQGIRDSIIFTATHLCHQVNNIVKIQGYKDDLPDDSKIYRKVFKNRSTHWNSAVKLLNALDDIASKDYVEKTSNYRNMVHHRIPPSLEYGITNFIKRIGYKDNSFDYITFKNGVEVRKTNKSKGISYGIGGTPPLKSIELINSFKQQLDLLKVAFEAYWEMVLEHHNFTKISRGLPNQPLHS
jgi:hypothetical protein